MNNQTKTLLGLGVAVVAGLGYFLYAKKQPKAFANLASDEFSDEPKMVPNGGPCNGDYGKDADGNYICCRSGYRSKKSLGKPCENVSIVSNVE